MAIIYVWECHSCLSQTKLNYNADEKDATRIAECICGDKLEWKENVYDAVKTAN